MSHIAKDRPRNFTLHFAVDRWQVGHAYQGLLQVY